MAGGIIIEMHNLIQWLENWADKPANGCIIDRHGSLGFSQLRDRSLCIANYISSMQSSRNSCPSGRTVIISFPKSADFIASMMGVLYSGNIYVPLDNRSPVKRNMDIISKTDPLLVITDSKGAEQFASYGMSQELLNLDCARLNSPANPDNLINSALRNTISTDPAYILFTSGSTGVPKGVVIQHSRVINYINWAISEFGLTESSVIGNQAPLYFTVSVMDIYLSIALGATLHLIPEDHFSKPQKLLSYLEEAQITQIFWVSSVYHNIAKAQALSPGGLSKLKEAWFVGEPMPGDSLEYWMKNLPDTRFINMYGSTETDMTVFWVADKNRLAASGKIPLGRPCANTDAFIIREDEKALACSGEVGEICIRGPALALGYFGEPERTNETFVKNPLQDKFPERIYKTGDLGEYEPDGSIISHGRKDFQFKHLGYRIEAGEIEAAAESLGAIKRAAAIYNGEKRQIVLFYEPVKDSGDISAALRRELVISLPIYMIPTRYISLETMPLNSNGKKDRERMRKEFLNND